MSYLAHQLGLKKWSPHFLFFLQWGERVFLSFRNVSLTHALCGYVTHESSQFNYTNVKLTAERYFFSDVVPLNYLYCLISEKIIFQDKLFVDIQMGGLAHCTRYVHSIFTYANPFRHNWLMIIFEIKCKVYNVGYRFSVMLINVIEEWIIP